MIRIVDWDRHQHYKGKVSDPNFKPTWIKVYRDLLTDYEFSQLAQDERWVLIGLWLLAAETRNRIPHDVEWLSQRLGGVSQDCITRLKSLGFIELDESRESLDKQSREVLDQGSRESLALEGKRRGEKNRGEEVDARVAALHPAAQSVVEKWDDRVLATLDTRFITAGMPDPSVKGLLDERRLELVSEALVEYGDRDFDARLFAGFVKRLRNAPRQGTEADAVRIAGERITPATWKPVVQERTHQPERVVVDVDNLIGGAS